MDTDVNGKVNGIWRKSEFFGALSASRASWNSSDDVREWRNVIYAYRPLADRTSGEGCTCPLQPRLPLSAIHPHELCMPPSICTRPPQPHMACSPQPHMPPSGNRMTDACEIITFLSSATHDYTCAHKAGHLHSILVTTTAVCYLGPVCNQ